MVNNMLFEEWWKEESGWGGELLLSEGNLAMSAWNAALEQARLECVKRDICMEDRTCLQIRDAIEDLEAE